MGASSHCKYNRVRQKVDKRRLEAAASIAKLSVWTRDLTIIRLAETACFSRTLQNFLSTFRSAVQKEKTKSNTCCSSSNSNGHSREHRGIQNNGRNRSNDNSINKFGQSHGHADINHNQENSHGSLYYAYKLAKCLIQPLLYFQ